MGNKQDSSFQCGVSLESPYYYHYFRKNFPLSWPTKTKWGGGERISCLEPKYIKLINPELL